MEDCKKTYIASVPFQKNKKKPLDIQRKYVLAIVLIITIFYKAFKYKNWGYVGRVTDLLLSLYFLFYFITSKTKSRKYNFRTEVLFLMLIPMMSMMNTYAIYGQPFYLSFYALIGTFSWMLYFLLHKHKVNELTVLCALLIVALIIFALQVIQQFTYPHVYFGVESEKAMIMKNITDEASMRNGIWRFRLHNNAYYTAPVLFAMWVWVQKKFNVRLSILISILLISVYLTLTRQVMGSCVLTIFAFLLYDNKMSKIKIFIWCLLIIICLYVSYKTLFSELAEQTQDESNEDNIRVIAALYFGGESIKNPLLFLFGHGVPYGEKGAYGEEMSYLNNMIGLYTQDVGFIGQIFERGILFVIATYILMCRIFFKLKNCIPQYIRMFVLFTGIMSPMIFPIISAPTIVVWTLLLYICDLHINKSSLALTPRDKLV